ncbi:MAG TPA: hypothetical protein PKH19_03640, partial [Candidatus Syntrophosphaera sp.]|nr:hypothetical protein [Candidatus Syntrophosphaera sp.]
MRIRLSLLLLLLVLASAGQAYTFGQNKLNLSPEDWSQLQTMHFDVYFPAQADSFGRLAALMAEEAYYRLRENFTYPTASRIPLILYRNKSGFQNTNIIYPLLTEGIGGFTESLHNRVVIPFSGSYAELETLMAHELTHAYVNALEKNALSSFFSLDFSPLPFWFSEGLPEFLSLGGGNDFNSMYILDLVLNDKMPALENVGGFYAYRLGESFLAWIAATWGRAKVPEYFYALRSGNNTENATKKVFGISFKDLQARWRFQLKRDHYLQAEKHGLPAQQLEQRTQSDKDGSYLNFQPRFAPNGERYAYFSSAGARYSVWLAGTHGLSAPKKLITGEASAKLEEFYYFRSNLSWFPDNQRLAFAAKTSRGDRIHILDVDKGRIVQSIKPGAFDSIYELDVSPDGRSLVFAGQRDLQCDLWLLDLQTRDLRQLTFDRYNDAQPRFTPDGRSVFFASERRRDDAAKRQGLFGDLVSEIYSLDLDSGALRQYTFENANCSFPVLSGDGQRLLYVSLEDGVYNLFALDLQAHARAKVTDILSGVLSADLSRDGRHLLVSNYFNGAWNIYYGAGPADSLDWQVQPVPRGLDSRDDLLAGIDLSQLDYFGRRERPRPARINPASEWDLRDPLWDEVPDFAFTREDSLQLVRDYSYDDRPREKGPTPVVKPYRTKFSLDSLWGGLAYSSGLGTVGYLELSMSDLMGNHGIGVNAEISGKLEDSSLLLTYLYLKNRTDLGLGIFNLNDEIILRSVQPGLDDYARLRQRQTGLYFLTRYPFSRFFRAELDHLVYQRGQYWADWFWDDPAGNTGHWGPNQDLGQDLVYTPSLRLVQDNALYGSTGPLLGWRTLYSVSTTLADGNFEYLTNYLDWRSYTMFSKRYSLALRAIAGLSSGDSPERFDLSGYYGVRGYEGNLTGTKKALASLELR